LLKCRKILIEAWEAATQRDANMDAEIKPYPRIAAAIKKGDSPGVAALLKEFPEMVELQVPGFGSWLLYAACHGNLEIVIYLISLGFDLNARDGRNVQTPLVNAASYGNVEIAKYLLSHGATIDTSSALLNPLFGAIIGRSPEIAFLLLDAGIDTEVRYGFGPETAEPMDAIAFAMMRGEREIAHMIALRNSNGDEAVAQAAMAEGLRIARTVTTPPQED